MRRFPSHVAIFILSLNLSVIPAADRDSLQDTTIAGMEVLSWKEMAAGVWTAVIGKKTDTTYLDFAGAPPRAEALGDMEAIQFPINKQRLRGIVQNNRSIVSIPLHDGEKLFGLGLQFKGLNRRGRVYHLRTDHYRDGNERLHAPVPFYISSDGYGVLFNSPQFISIYAGIGNRKDSSNLPPIRDRNTDRQWQARPDSDAVEASVMAKGMEVIVFGGPTMLDVVRRYNLYCGGGALPPKWGLGFWHRMRTHASDQEVIREVAEFERRDFPLDVIGLEPGWHTKSYPCTFEWDQGRFPEPAQFLKTMVQKGVHINLWENPYISPDAGIYEAIKPYSGSHMVWLGIVPDYTLPQARKIMSDQHEKEHLALGVSGYKIDEVDGYDFWLWPDHAVFPSGTDAQEMRQTYALQLQKTLMSLFRSRNQRTYSLIRASNAAASAYPFAIYTDHYDHRGFITALVNSGLCGVLYTPEIRSARSDEEWLRRMQSVCFSHMIQLNGWSSNTKPWSFPNVEDEVREVIKLRIRLMPYIYNAFARYHFEGIPPIRPMILEPGYLHQENVVPGKLDDSQNPYAMAVRKDVTDQYMFGESILVAPLVAGQESRTVILPKGRWYDFYTGEYAGAGEIITVAPPLNIIPLYVKDGGIIPMISALNQISKRPANMPIELRHYGRSSSTTRLYDDDGESFDYETGDHCWFELKATTGPDGKMNGAVPEKSGSFQSAYHDFRWVFMTGLN